MQRRGFIFLLKSKIQAFGNTKKLLKNFFSVNSFQKILNVSPEHSFRYFTRTNLILEGKFGDNSFNIFTFKGNNL